MLVGFVNSGHTLETSAKGSAVIGYSNAGDIKATAAGAFASGYTRENPGGGGAPTSLITASNKGAFAQGYCKSEEYPSFIKSTGIGSFAQGAAQGGASGFYAQIYAKANGAFAQGVASGSNNGTGFIYAEGIGSLAHGQGRCTTTGQSGLIHAESPGSVALGKALTPNATPVSSSVHALGVGAFAQGYARAATIETLSDGSFAQGKASASSLIQAGDVSYGRGCFAQGYAEEGGKIVANSKLSIYSSIFGGSFAQGFCQSGKIYASFNGAFAQGYVGNFYNGVVPDVGENYIKATYGGAFAQGWCATQYTGGYIASHIVSSGYGTFAQGQAYGGFILAGPGGGAFAQGYAGGGVISATQPGAFAQGFTKLGAYYDISATGGGAFAHGYAKTGDIIASADNAAQFGEGTNAVENSLQVGTDFLAKANGQHAGKNDNHTLSAAATTFVATSNVMTITGDGGANTVATITGGIDGQLLTLIFVDALITITDTDSHTANTVDLAGTATNFTSADDTVLQLVFDGTSWYEVSQRGTVEITQVSSNYTALPTDDVILCDTTGGSITVTLFSRKGKVLNIKKIDSTGNTVIVDGNGSEIDGGPTAVLTVQFETITIVNDNFAWWIL